MWDIVPENKINITPVLEAELFECSINLQTNYNLLDGSQDSKIDTDS